MLSWASVRMWRKGGRTTPKVKGAGKAKTFVSMTLVPYLTCAVNRPTLNLTSAIITNTVRLYIQAALQQQGLEFD
jgi:hypothetical protein